MTDQLALPRRYRDQLEALLSKHVPGVEVWAYGSRVNGESHEGSDLDLVLRGPALEPLGDGFYDMLEAIEKSNVPILIQAHDWTRLPESFHREIERGYVVLQEGVEERNSDKGNEWRNTRLNELVHLHTEQVSPASRPDTHFYHFSIPAFDENTAPAVELGGDIGSNKFTVPAGSILVSKLNPRVPRVWEPDVNDEDLAVASTEFLVLQPKEIDRRFLKYLCLSLAVRSRMEAMVTGTSGSHQRVRPADALNIEVQLPPLPQQRAIAHILGTLDDKIELNPSDERDAGGDGAGAVQVVVRGLRAGACQDGGPLAPRRVAPRPPR